jgi:hypothetical protein
MTREQKEQLREVLIDYLQMLSSVTIHNKTPQQALYNTVIADKKMAQVRLLLREVA